jgi:hypothetical protein
MNKRICTLALALLTLLSTALEAGLGCRRGNCDA